MSTLAQRLKHYRKLNDLTLEEVSKRLDMSSPNYAKYENGTRNPKDEKLLEIAGALNTSYRNLVIGEEEELLNLLYRYTISLALGDKESFIAFYNDMNIDDAYAMIGRIFEGYKNAVKKNRAEDYKTYVEENEIGDLIHLYNQYDNLDKLAETMTKTMDMDEPVYKKLLFTISAHEFLNDYDVDYIIDKMKRLDNQNYSEKKALQRFAIKILIPYLYFVTDTLDMLVSNNCFIIDSFDNYFLNQSF